MELSVAMLGGRGRLEPGHEGRELILDIRLPVWVPVHLLHQVSPGCSGVQLRPLQLTPTGLPEVPQLGVHTSYQRCRYHPFYHYDF